MEFSVDWLKQYADLDGIPVGELRERLTLAGLAVEGVETVELSGGGQDVVFDIDVTTNRPDAMNHLGLAREAAVLFARPFKPPATDYEPAAEKAAAAAGLTVEDFTLCPRYNALVIRNVEVGPSPEWLQRRLEAIGSRAINNIVDITNYVLWETGQPLHAFDLDKLGGAEIRVRRAREGESLVTLDGEPRDLDPDVLVIADSSAPVALAGIMGGLDSEVTEATRHVLLESAHFDPGTVRQGARKLRMSTDASHRFERGADPEACAWAARRAAALMVELAGGEALAGELEAKQLRDDWPPVVDLDLAKLNRFGGGEISAEETERILGGLGFGLDRQGRGRWRVTAPSWRYYDFENPYPADVYEEVLRISGFDRIPATLPKISGVDAPERAGHRLRRRIQDHLAACGYREAINYAFHDRQRDEAFPALYEGRAAVPLANPLSDLYAVMRRSLLPNLVASALYNQRRGAQAVRFFEIGHVFSSTAGGHEEEDALALVLGGRLGQPWEREAELDFFDLKGAVESLGEALGVSLDTRPAAVRKLVEGSAAEIRLGDRVLGYLGELEDEETAWPFYVAELRVGELLAGAHDLKVSLPSRFPGIVVDSTLTHSLGVRWSEIATAIGEIGAEDLASFSLKDVYRGAGVPDGAVNTTVSFHYNSAERSLTQGEVNERHQRLWDELHRRFGYR